MPTEVWTCGRQPRCMLMSVEVNTSQANPDDHRHAHHLRPALSSAILLAADSGQWLRPDRLIAGPRAVGIPSQTKRGLCHWTDGGDVLLLRRPSAPARLQARACETHRLDLAMC